MHRRRQYSFSSMSLVQSIACNTRSPFLPSWFSRAFEVAYPSDLFGFPTAICCEALVAAQGALESEHAGARPGFENGATRLAHGLN